METRKIKLLVSVGGVDFSWHPGQVVELPAAEAEGWADGERAVYASPSDEERDADVERLGELLTEALAERDDVAAKLAAVTAERDALRAQLEGATDAEQGDAEPEPVGDDAKPAKATKSTPAKAGK